MPDNSERPLRLCQECGGVDDHPRHVVLVNFETQDAVPDSEWFNNLPNDVPISAIAQALAPTTIVRHIDCCAALGCPVCIGTEEITGGVRGQELIDTIAGGALDDYEAPVVTNEELGING